MSAPGEDGWSSVTALDRLGRTPVPGLLEKAQLARPLVLVYHGLLDPAGFRRQIAFLVDRYRVMDLDALVETIAAGRTPPRGCAAVTFDDGLRSVSTLAYPVLRDLRCPATVFVNTAAASSLTPAWFLQIRHLVRTTPCSSIRVIANGAAREYRTRTCAERTQTAQRLIELCLQDRRALGDDPVERIAAATQSGTGEAALSDNEAPASWDELAAMERDGLVRIGNHTHTHRLMPSLTEDELRYEVLEAHRLLLEHASRPSRVFCYPNGGIDARADGLLHAAGYIGAVTTVQRRVAPGTAPLRVPRIGVQDFESLETFRARTSGAVAPARRLRDLSRRLPSRDWESCAGSAAGRGMSSGSVSTDQRQGGTRSGPDCDCGKFSSTRPGEDMSSPCPRYEIRLVRTMDGFDDLFEPWEELRSKASHSPIFASHDFASAWLRYYGTGAEPFVLLAESGGALVGALPLCVMHARFGKRSIRLLGDGYADYSDALVDPDSPAACDALVDALFRELKQWDSVYLRYLSKESQLLRSLTPSRRADWLVCGKSGMEDPYIEVVGAWPGQVSRQFSQQLRSKRRKLEKAHGEVSVSWGTTPSEVSGGLEVLYRLHRLRWETMKGALSKYSIAAARQEHGGMFTRLAERQHTLLVTLSVANRPIALAVNLVDGDTIYYCQTAFDPEFAKYSPSALLLAELVNYCDSHGAGVLDLLRGDESYKYRWTDKSRNLSEVWLSRPGLVNAAVAAWTLQWRGRLRETPVVGPAIVKTRWRVKRLASSRLHR